MAFVVALALGLLIRVAILGNTAVLGTPIEDEQHYAHLADNIEAGNGFAWAPGEATSIRPPLYPAMLAATWAAAGSRNLQVVRVAQIGLALLTAWLVYLLGARVYSPAVGRTAALIFWLYPSLIFFNFLILTETLFTFLLVAFLLSTVMLVQTPRALLAFATGAVLALAALARSILWPAPLLLCPLVIALIPGSLVRRVALSALVLVGYSVVIAPWAIRNTRLQGTFTVVDTMGGINLRMGNYEFTPDDRMWDAVSLTGTKSWVHGLSIEPGMPVTEGRKEKWAQRKAIEFMVANPALTLRRSLIKFADFWGLEREFMAGVQQGMFAPPAWFSVPASAVILLGYVLVTVAGAAGIWLAAPADKRLHIVLLLPLLIIMGAHTIVFGHSRYHLPLVPILALYASALVVQWSPAFRVNRRPILLGAAATVTILLSVWIRQVVVTDLDRIKALLNHVG